MRRLVTCRSDMLQVATPRLIALRSGSGRPRCHDRSDRGLPGENSSNFMKQLASSCYFTAALAIDHALLVTLTAEGLDVAETSPIIVAVTKHMTIPVQTVSMICIPLLPNPPALPAT